MDKDSLGQHHISVKLNFMSPQTVQPLQSHSCSFQHLDMTFPNLLLLFPVFNHVSHHLLIGRACCPRCCSQIWEGQHSPQREVPQTSYIFKKKKMFCSPVLPLVSLPHHHHWLGDTGLDNCLHILLACFAPGWLSVTSIKVDGFAPF